MTVLDVTEGKQVANDSEEPEASVGNPLVEAGGGAVAEAAKIHHGRGHTFAAVRHQNPRLEWHLSSREYALCNSRNRTKKTTDLCTLSSVRDHIISARALVWAVHGTRQIVAP